MSDATTRHPDAQQIADYVHGALTPPERDDIEEHLTACSDCRDAAMTAVAFLAEEQPATVTAHEHSAPTDAHEQRARVVAHEQPTRMQASRRGTRWMTYGVGLAAAAAVLLAVLFQPPWLLERVGLGSARSDLVALTSAVGREPTRPVEGRLTGFPYGPPPTTRGTAGREPSPDVSIAAARIQQRAGNAAGADDLAALGVASLVLADIDGAITALERASTQTDRASIASDLAAAYLARGATSRDDLIKARDVAQRTIAGAGAPVEAWFNYALALQHLGDPAAANAWRDYLQRDGSSPWADEARRYLQAIPPAQ